jgi:hypothetical protein
MARRDKGLLNDLAYVPWWVSVVFAGVVFIGLKFVLPALMAGNPILKGLGENLPQLACFPFSS